MSYASDFWQETDRHHDLAEMFEDGVEQHHPERVSSRRMCACLDYCSSCVWAGTQVTYYRYNGPNV